MKSFEYLADLLTNHPVWGQNNTPIWLASHFSLKRNLSQFFFPEKMSQLEAKKLVTLLEETLLKLPFFKRGFSLTSADLSPIQKEGLAEYFLMDYVYPLDNHPHRYFIDERGGLLVKVLERDHLVLECIESESSWSERWRELVTLEEEIGKIHDFAFDPKFGYLSSNPNRCGTALSVEAFLHTPCLIDLERKETFFDLILDKNVAIRGIGAQESFIGDLTVIYNLATLGVSEEHILDSIHKMAIRLIQLETLEREKLKERPDPLIVDRVSRAYGLLLYSRQINTQEALSALSLLKLGIDLQWVDGITDREINELFFKCRRAQIALRAREELSSEELSKNRAEYLKKQCEKIKLTVK